MKCRLAAGWLAAGMWLCAGIAGAAQDPVEALRAELSRSTNVLALAGGSSLSYVLGPNDLIQLSVYGEDDLNVSRRIGPDEQVTLPLIESVRIGGLTVERATKLIREAYAKDYLVNPKVEVTVIEKTPRTFNILGYVRSPGAYKIEGESISLVSAIASAGGGTPEAKLSKVTISRPVAGQEAKQVFTKDAEKMIRDPRVEPFLIRQGDTIYITDKAF